MPRIQIREKHEEAGNGRMGHTLGPHTPRRSVLVRMNEFGYIASPKNETSDPDFRLAVHRLFEEWDWPYSEIFLEDNIFEKVLDLWGQQEKVHIFNSQRYKQQVSELLISESNTTH